jgi:two-component system, cell cycle sensor histidine kinase and response regulator CckA
MDKKNYIEQEIIKMLQSWGTIALTYGGLTILLLSVLDYFVTPENFNKFMVYRAVSALLFSGVFYLNRKKKNKYYQTVIFFIGTVIVSTMVELMVLSFGGHQSTYYAGMIIIAVFSLGFLPLFSIRTTILLAFMIYSIYLLPIISFDHITNIRLFLNNNVFLLSIITISVSWRYYNDRLLFQKLSLEYDLSKDKEQLELYSQKLKNLVEERTKELYESEQWHRSLFENATDGIIVLDKNSIIVNANDKACEMHGFSRQALVGAHIKLLVGDSDKDTITRKTRRILDGESLVFEAKNNRKDGTSICVEISSKAITIGNEVFIQSFYRDITEKKKFQEHLLQSQKMESVGVLAGGIAHDFNNILTAILGHTDLIRRFAVLNEKATRSLNVIEDASRRAGRMISKLLGFARKSKHELTPINLNDVVYETIKLLEQVFKKSIDLSVELDNRLPLIQGDINQMEQVIMNFLVNARDAMPNGGRIVIKTQARTVVKGMPDVPPYVPPGEYVQISVSDTGTGIPEDIKNKIFEPFFTTKEPGKGTGLGLSMVYGAINDHQGYLSVESTVGVGSVFTVFLPAAAPATVAGTKEAASPGSGKQTLLIVDDEQDILDIMRDSLENQGYKVFATGDSTVAIDIYRRIFNEVALIITDIVMPGIDGRELIRQIKVINPDVKVLAISGYTKYVGEKEDIKDIDGFLQKPFESYYLLSVVKRILESKTKKFIPV